MVIPAAEYYSECLGVIEQAERPSAAVWLSVHPRHPGRLSGATVLHYDEDYDRIAKVTGQPVEWVASKGSL
jgi:hypothetical protein